MRLIITRHGQTEENVAGIMQGHLPGKLSEEGIRQAKKLADRLKNEKIDLIFSSDLARAADTAVEISFYHPQAKLEFTEELRERHLGDFTGKHKSEVGVDLNQTVSGVYDQTPNGENLESLYKRAESFLHKVLSAHHKDNVLFVGHSGINKALLTVIMGKKPQDITSVENLHNTSVNIFEIDENRNHTIHLLNDISHLE